MKLVWSEQAWQNYLAWQQDKKTLKRINRLIEDIQRNGYNTIGKPEPLKGDLSGFWSVRIDNKNRLIFKINNGALEIWQCSNHYDDH